MVIYVNFTCQVRARTTKHIRKIEDAGAQLPIIFTRLTAHYIQTKVVGDIYRTRRTWKRC